MKPIKKRPKGLRRNYLHPSTTQCKILKLKGRNSKIKR